jgi:prepilin-type processing-associated H-X9-DG protein/prepilin-type N-terminal cleavage/methylation domain-containing protein
MYASYNPHRKNRSTLCASKHRHYAFTLMELLVVISLIVLLIAMLSPSLRQARMAARATICASNQKQIGNTLTNYSDDHRFYPIGIDEHNINNERVWLWPPQLRQYTQGNTEVFKCPQAPPHTLWTTTYGSGEPQWYGYYEDETRILGRTHTFSYGYNVWGANIGIVPNPGMGVYRDNPQFGETLATRVVSPSNMIAFADSNLTDYWSGYIGIYRPGQFPSEIHFGNANFLFCDGHAELIESNTMIDITDPAVNRRWNTDHQVH